MFFSFLYALGLQKTQKLLEKSYSSYSGFGKTTIKGNKKEVDTTYGEILPEGVFALIEFLSPTQHDVFVDLGCGTGKVVVQFFLQTPVRGSYGLDIVEERYEMAKQALNDLRKKKPDLFPNHRHIKFFKQNILDFDFQGVTIIFMNAVCFSDELIKKIIHQININPNIRTVISLKSLQGLRNLTQEKEVPVKVSWYDDQLSSAYVYTRD